MHGRIRWGGRILALLAIVALTVYLWHAGLTRASAIASVAVLLVAIVTLIAPYLFPTNSGAAPGKVAADQAQVPSIPIPGGPATVPKSARAHAEQFGALPEDPSTTRGTLDWSAEATVEATPAFRQSLGRPAVSARSSLPIMDGAIRKLRDLLVGANLTEGEAKRIVRDSGIDAQAAWWTFDPGSFWQAVLDRAHTAWSMENLFAAADPVFGSNPAWNAAKQDYLVAREGGISG